MSSQLSHGKFCDVGLSTLKQTEEIDRYLVFKELMSNVDAPNYLSIISTLIDLVTMKTKLNNRDYGKGTEGASKLYTDFLFMLIIVAYTTMTVE